MTDAPKIDTQAPAHICAYDDGLGAPDSRTWSDVYPIGSPYIRADLADARAAAAAQAMRFWLQEAVNDCMEGDVPYSQSSLHWIWDARAALEATEYTAAALDRLIAERVREAVEAEREACALIAEVQFDERGRSRAGHHSEMDWTDGYRDATRAAAAAIRARCSKEGRDG